jgi:hypothetical protein
VNDVNDVNNMKPEINHFPTLEVLGAPKHEQPLDDISLAIVCKLIPSSLALTMSAYAVGPRTSRAVLISLQTEDVIIFFRTRSFNTLLITRVQMVTFRSLVRGVANDADTASTASIVIWIIDPNVLLLYPLEINVAKLFVTRSFIFCTVAASTDVVSVVLIFILKFKYSFNIKMSHTKLLEEAPLPKSMINKQKELSSVSIARNIEAQKIILPAKPAVKPPIQPIQSGQPVRQEQRGHQGQQGQQIYRDNRLSVELRTSANQLQPTRRALLLPQAPAVIPQSVQNIDPITTPIVLAPMQTPIKIPKLVDTGSNPVEKSKDINVSINMLPTQVDGGKETKEEQKEEQKGEPKKRGRKKKLKTNPQQPSVSLEEYKKQRTDPVYIAKKIEGCVAIPTKDFEHIEAGDRIKYLKKDGNFVDGGFVWYKKIHADTKKPFWMVGKQRIMDMSEKHFPVYWEKVKALWRQIQVDTDAIKNSLDTKQNYINDIALFLLEKYGDEFKNYMNNREKLRLERSKKLRSLNPNSNPETGSAKNSASKPSEPPQLARSVSMSQLPNHHSQKRV